jgi:uncharacterized protein
LTTAALPPPSGPDPTAPPCDRALAQRALEAYQRGQEALRRGDWAAYGAEQKRLEEALRELTASKK